MRIKTHPKDKFKATFKDKLLENKIDTWTFTEFPLKTFEYCNAFGTEEEEVCKDLLATYCRDGDIASMSECELRKVAKDFSGQTVHVDKSDKAGKLKIQKLHADTGMEIDYMIYFNGGKKLLYSHLTHGLMQGALCLN